jgi:hypothetical protein
MAVIKKHKPGTFCWADLGTPNTVAAKKFYTGLFGWKVTEFPMGPGDEKYSMMRVKGKNACALYPMDAAQKKAKVPPFWLPYIWVANADATVKKAKAAGGKVLFPALTVMDQGRMAILQDPSGVNFGIWQAKKHRGTELDDTPGTICWHDLSTKKRAAAAKFYEKVFGWKKTDLKYEAGAYHLFNLGKKGIGGMWPQPMEQLPSSWLTYWNVANCARSVTKLKRLGGKLMMDTMTVPGMCRFAIAKDPQGAPFGILQPL